MQGLGNVLLIGGKTGCGANRDPICTLYMQKIAMLAAKGVC